MSTASVDTGPARGAEHAAELEQYTIEPIPLNERHGRPRDLFTIWFTTNLMPLTIVTGALATVLFGLPFIPAVIAIVLGNLIGAVFMALHSAQGPKLGIPQMIQSRAQYGVLGAILVVGIVVFMYIGFFASNLILGGQSLNQMTSAISVNWGIVICAVVSFVIVVFGYDLIHFLNRWLAIAFGIVMIVVTILIFHGGLPAHFLSIGHFSWGAFVSAMVVTGVLWQIAYAPYVSDYSRYMSPEEGTRRVFWYSYWGVVIGSTSPMLIGALVGVVSKDPSQVAAIFKLSLGFGWVVMLVFTLGIINTNVLNAYGGVLCAITVRSELLREVVPWGESEGPVRRYIRCDLPGGRARLCVHVPHVVPELHPLPALPAGPVDAHQPNRLLPRGSRRLRRAGAVQQERRDLRTLQLGHHRHLRPGLRGRDPVHQHDVLRGSCGQGAQRRRLLVADRDRHRLAPVLHLRVAQAAGQDREGRARRRLSAGEVRRGLMKWFYSETHRLHDPDLEVWAGTPGPGTEVAARAEAIAAALAADPAFVRGIMDEHGPGPIERVHDPALLRWLQDAWRECRPFSESREIIPDTICHAGMVEGCRTASSRCDPRWGGSGTGASTP